MKKISQLKTALHESIENINDSVVLNTLNEISSHHYNLLQEPELNDYQLSRLKEADDQIKNGEFYTNAQANELIKKWLSK
jgi:hypothetical protein